MVKISDILKQPEEKPKKPSQEDSSIKIPKKEEQKESPPKQTVESLQKTPKEPSDVMKEKLKIADKQITSQLYNQTIDLVKKILEKGRNNEPIEGKIIKDIIDRLTDQLILENQELIGLIRSSTPENYLLGHAVNTCILSIILGIGLKYDRQQTVELGVASLLHDIGMVRVCDLSDKPGKLSEEEFNQVKKHPIYGVEILGLSKNINQIAIYVAEEHHESVNGVGYPKGLKGKKINEYAKIVAVVDAYEALTHSRPHREAFLPFDAMREILKDKVKFDAHYLKILIEQISIYPVGSWIELNSGEVGRVIKINKSNPLRPLIDILFDVQGHKVKEHKCIDLTQTPNLYVKKPLHENEIKS